jgi:isochorismate synthase
MMADWERRVRDRAAAAIRRARNRRRAILLSLAAPIAPPEDVLALLHAPAHRTDHCFVWQRPADALSIAGLGAAATCEAEGDGRFTAVAGACTALIDDALIETAADPSTAGPLFVGGFAFAPDAVRGVWQGFPPGQLVLPRVTIVQRGQLAALTFNVLLNGESDPEEVARQLTAEMVRVHTPVMRPARSIHADAAPPRYEAASHSLPSWQDAVAETLADISAGRVQKLVLARTCTVQSARVFDCVRIVRQLRHAYPDCTTFWLGTPSGSFLGATPELLVRLTGSEIETVAIAGTVARGGSAAHDEALAHTLRVSGKERHEHAVVVDAIAGILAPLCRRLDVPAGPHVVQLENVQHLISPIAGTLRQPLSILSLVERLHPSPAVAGFPSDAALTLLAHREQLDRGWYAGPIGWMDARQCGEFVVALRSALVQETRATLFAGAGIVAGSDPEAELAETRLKLQPLLSALMEL